MKKFLICDFSGYITYVKLSNNHYLVGKEFFVKMMREHLKIA